MINKRFSNNNTSYLCQRLQLDESSANTRAYSFVVELVQHPPVF